MVLKSALAGIGLLAAMILGIASASAETHGPDFRGVQSQSVDDRGAPGALTLIADVAGADRTGAPEGQDGSGGVASYVLGSGDSLRIVVFGEDNLSGQFAVSGDGRISFPLIGDIQASGRTVRQVQDAITAALKDRYLKDPKVSAEMLTFRPYYIYGEVNRPGEFPYMDGLSADNAIAAAGGYTYRANEHTIFLKRSNEKTEKKVRLTPDLQVQPGDTIRVPERYF